MAPKGTGSSAAQKGHAVWVLLFWNVSRLVRTLLCLCWVSFGFAQAPPLVRILTEELDRNFRVLKEKGDPAPYYIAYEVTEQESSSVSATLGALRSNRTGRTRTLDITVRVGSPKLDNYHRVRGERAFFTSGAALPIEDSAPAIQRIIWLETDRVYRLAAERLIKIKSNREVSVAEEDDSDDFSKEEPAVFFQPVPPVNFPWINPSLARKSSLGSSPSFRRSSHLKSASPPGARRGIS